MSGISDGLPSGLSTSISASKNVPARWSVYRFRSQFFVPKCDTPFQWVGQDDFATIERKQAALLDSIRSRKISVAWHDVHTSVLEGVIARGDRRVGRAIYLAWKKGCRLDSWSECFDYDKMDGSHPRGRPERSNFTPAVPVIWTRFCPGTILTSASPRTSSNGNGKRRSVPK